MNIATISTNVQAILDNLAWTNTVLPHPPAKNTDFNGYPSIAHYYQNTDSNYATVTQNRRTIEYVVELYLVTNEATTVAQEFAEMYIHTDNLIQTLDESIDLSSTALGLARACDIMRPVPGELARITTNEGEGLMMTIRLLCTADVSFK